MEAKEENRNIGPIPPFGDTEPGMSPQSQPPTSDLSSHQSGHPVSVGGEIELLVDADTAAEFLQVSPRRILDLARRGSLPGYPLGSGSRHLWRFRISELATSIAERGVNCANAAVCAKEKNLMARTRNQHGSLRILSRKSGDVFEYRYYRTRADGKRVHANFVVGSVAELKTETEAWAKLRKTGFDPNVRTATGRPIMFGELAEHYARLELSEDQAEAVIPKAHSTITTYRRYLAKHVLPRWKVVRASEMEPVAVQNWLRDLRRQNGLANGTLVKLRNVMLVVFKHAQRYGLIPRTQEANPIAFVRQSCVSDYDPVVLTLAQCVDILANLDDMHRVLVLADAATGLRVSELLALRWSDIDWRNSCIRVSRAYVYGKFGLPKSKASQRPVPLHPLLAALLEAWRKETPYCRDTDLVFPSFRLHGEKPPRANMLVANHLQPAARKAGIGGPVGFHTLRRTLASVLVANGNDPKLVQELLRHSNVRTTLDIYAKATTSAKLEAQGWVLQQLLAPDTKSAVV
jgi:integrase